MKNKLLIGLLLITQVSAVIAFNGYERDEWENYQAYRKARFDEFPVQMGINNERVANAKKALQKDPSNKKLQMGLAIAQEEQRAYLESSQDMPAVMTFEAWSSHGRP
jgi:hypothetical protein